MKDYIAKPFEKKDFFDCLNRNLKERIEEIKRGEKINNYEIDNENKIINDNDINNENEIKNNYIDNNINNIKNNLILNIPPKRENRFSVYENMRINGKRNDFITQIEKEKFVIVNNKTLKSSSLTKSILFEFDSKKYREKIKNLQDLNRKRKNTLFNYKEKEEIKKKRNWSISVNRIENFNLLKKEKSKDSNNLENIFKNFDYNLKGINELTDGDIEENESIIDSFIEEFPKLLDELEISLRNKDIEAIAKISHKMKSPVALFGMDRLLEDIIYLEKYFKKVDKDLYKFQSDFEISKVRRNKLFLNLKNN